MDHVPLFVMWYLFAALLFYEKWITIYHAKQYIGEYIPSNKNFVVFSSNPAQEIFSPEWQSPRQEQRNWLKTALAISLFVFSMSFLAWKFYSYLGFWTTVRKQKPLF